MRMKEREIFVNLNGTKLVMFWAPLVLIIVILSAIPSPPLLAEDRHLERNMVELTENAVLADYLAYAALHNAGLEAAFNRLQAALERIPQARALPDPRLTFAYFIQEIETRVGPQQQRLGLVQMFPWFGKLKLMGSAAQEAAHAERQKYEKIKLDLFYRVKETFYEYYYVSRAVTIIEKNIQLLGSLEEVMRTKYSTGSAAYSDLLKVQVESDKLKDWLQSMEEMLRPVRARLNSALNRPVYESLPLPKPIIQGVSSVPYPQLLEWFKENNPDMKALHHMISKEKVETKLARKNYWPDISLGLDYIFTGEAVMPGVLDSGRDPLAAVVTVNLPIHFKKNRAAVKEAAARFKAAQKERQEKENNLLAHLDMVYYQFQDAGRKLKLYKEALIPRADQALKVSQSAFEVGKMDFLNLIDSLRTLLGLELASERALANHFQKQAELEMLVGKEW